MSIENQKTIGDDEYQYPNEEYVAETTPPDEQQPAEPKPANFFVRFVQNNKRITAVIAVVLIVLVAFKLMSSHRSKSIDAPPPPAQPVAQQPVQSVSAPDPEMMSKLDALKQDEQSSQTTISQLQNQLQDVRNQLNQTSVQQSQLNQAIAALVDQMKQLGQSIQSEETKKSAPAKKSAPTAPPVVFHLKAIVPGRAWIISNDGLSESVSVGDPVPQYGTVKVVDANRGMVLMSSGKVIGYGANDR
ncbi:type IVB secretion system protein IcmG/DotF [Coxiella burnetii]|uniref:IcmG n=1 Tax=Coxiella burnetii (strain RSA 493 / Nine Mile phase I) TaxID=227377 RepID=Q83B87_COXBU|nr:type IVB secretion system protein IcmG/DotF [Coxiella burnetii]NP_820608.1 Icm secretion system protein IcmG [Coxiella burnetii RSA 493]AAO91122.1 IcmG [Coxiella burnetii RSA 493]ABX79058.1 IcmG protein [Coxiella burnetii RSA 331]AML48475.1 type IV secretion protein IcmG [Coxiella burnetii]AML54477.1 type IV secretion protein IcmG [Coxiella burnetii]ARI66382.1 type IV secretion protein IcmG [Coxiella burnetii]